MWITVVCLGHSCFVVCGSTTAIVSFIICGRAQSSMCYAAPCLLLASLQTSFSVQLQEVVKCFSVDYFKV